MPGQLTRGHGVHMAGRIWTASRADQGWRVYGGGGVYDPTSPTGGHYDHIHVSVAI